VGIAIKGLKRNWMLAYLWVEGGIILSRFQWSFARLIGGLGVQHVLCLANLLEYGIESCVGITDIMDV